VVLAPTEVRGVIMMKMTMRTISVMVTVTVSWVVVKVTHQEGVDDDRWSQLGLVVILDLAILFLPRRRCHSGKVLRLWLPLSTWQVLPHQREGAEAPGDRARGRGGL
jgi:steroid 5-alpha reductase family enzyme